MRSSAFVAVAALFTGFASAFTYPNTTACCTVDPSTVDSETRSTWCLAQTNTCNSVCGGFGSAENNTCIESTLSWNCTCEDGKTPNITAYQQSLAAQECLVWVERCVDNAPDDATGQAFCRSFVCGNLTTDDDSAAVTSNAGVASASATGGSASSSASSGVSTTAEAAVTSTTASASTTSSTGAATALAMAKNYGTPALAAGLFAIFGFAL